MMVFFLVGCKTEKEEYFIKPDFTVELNGNPLDISVIGNTFIKSFNNKLLIRNTSDLEGLFTLYETDSFKVVSKFGSLGQGPNEFTDPIWAAQTVGTTNNALAFNVHDIAKNTFVKVQLNSDNPEPRFDYHRKKLPNNLVDRVQKVVFDSDSLLIFQPEMVGRLVFHRKDKNENKIIPYKAITSFEIDKDAMWKYFDGYYAVNTDLGLVFSATALLGQVDFYSLSGEHIVTLVYDDHNHKSKSVTGQTAGETNDILNYANDVEATKDFIYLLVHDRTQGDSRAMRFKDRSRVLKFDWGGRFLKEYKLDHFATSIAVNDAKSKLYAYNYFVEENYFYSYSLD